MGWVLIENVLYYTGLGLRIRMRVFHLHARREAWEGSAQLSREQNDFSFHFALMNWPGAQTQTHTHTHTHTRTGFFAIYRRECKLTQKGMKNFFFI